MNKIIQLFQDTAFDPELIQLMGQAYDKACQAMHESGQPAIVREIIAKKILQAANKGERDPGKLCEQALRAVKL